MSRKDTRIEALIEPFRGGKLEAHYLGFFACFNRQMYFEAHEVLEDLWLRDRSGQAGNFYKGLIQLAGAFVHLQKERPSPALALFRLAAANLRPYGPAFEELDLEATRTLIERWASRVAAGGIESHARLVARQPPSLSINA